MWACHRAPRIRVWMEASARLKAIQRWRIRACASLASQVERVRRTWMSVPPPPATNFSGPSASMGSIRTTAPCDVGLAGSECQLQIVPSTNWFANFPQIDDDDQLVINPTIPNISHQWNFYCFQIGTRQQSRVFRVPYLQSLFTTRTRTKGRRAWVGTESKHNLSARPTARTSARKRWII